jgi:hypothetical protein
MYARTRSNKSRIKWITHVLQLNCLIAINHWPPRSEYPCMHGKQEEDALMPEDTLSLSIDSNQSQLYCLIHMRNLCDMHQSNQSDYRKRRCQPKRCKWRKHVSWTSWCQWIMNFVYDWLLSVDPLDFIWNDEKVRHMERLN